MFAICTPGEVLSGGDTVADGGGIEEPFRELTLDGDKFINDLALIRQQLLGYVIGRAAGGTQRVGMYCFPADIRALEQT